MRRGSIVTSFIAGRAAARAAWAEVYREPARYWELYELAEKLGMDPIDLRIRNEPERDPVEGTPFSARHIVEAWRAGAERFGWSRRAAPGVTQDGRWLVGMGVAAAFLIVKAL